MTAGAWQQNTDTEQINSVWVSFLFKRFLSNLLHPHCTLKQTLTQFSTGALIHIYYISYSSLISSFSFLLSLHPSAPTPYTLCVLKDHNLLFSLLKCSSCHEMYCVFLKRDRNANKSPKPDITNNKHNIK